MCCGVGVSEGKEAQFLWKGNSAFHAIFFSVPSHSCACSSPGLNAVSSPNSYSIYSLCLRIWHLIIVRSPAVLCGLVLSTQIESKLSAGMGHILYSITPGWTNSSSQNSNTSWWIFISVIKGLDIGNFCWCYGHIQSYVLVFPQVEIMLTLYTS